jgi:putative transferase (TIGR04331 family)
MPKRPKGIATANAFTYDDLFKIWTAGAVAEGVPYLVLQHGGAYGMHRRWSYRVEVETSDAFVTWGWSYDPESQLPGPVTSSVARPKQSRSKPRKMLIHMPPYSRRHGLHDLWDENFKHGLEIADFLTGVRKEIREETVLRFHHEAKTAKAGDVEFFTDKFPDVHIDVWQCDLVSLRQESKIVISTYDSTVMLECLAADLPTMGFWPAGIEHVSEDARDLYEGLVRGGIVHLSPGSLMESVNDVWNNPRQWWDSTEVRTYREPFADRYCSVSNNVSQDLSKIMRDFSAKFLLRN